VTVVDPAKPTMSVTAVQIGKVRGGPPLTQVLRKDRWWLQPALIVFGLTLFGIYATWAAFRNGHYYAGVSLQRDYLSPFYSPCLADVCNKNGHYNGWGPIIGDWWAISPALIVLIFPLGFRMTCYYYRKSYYRSFWLSPPACAVPDAGSAKPDGHRKRYTGETRFPLLIQNIHRYFWYAAVIFAAILTWDAIASFWFPGLPGKPSGVGMGLGSLIFVINAVLIWSYTLGCHSCRHLCGGGTNKLSEHASRYWLWKNIVSKLNARHQLLAWLSLIWIAFTDYYVYLVSTGMIHDPKFF
jgi:hypothetical protein